MNSSLEWSPRLTVATIIERDGQFLLVEEYADGDELVYNQPAGHLDEHETL
ncbi:MAG TPA: NUDIX hydrolase, partial [Gammaproteobacteria bacterium]|nr:NUDIX hydrolase [Gammaproteobacteria bacterium]